MLKGCRLRPCCHQSLLANNATNFLPPCRVSQIGEFVPIAPALCCKSCISDKVIPADSCFDLNFCSGHGVCNLGVCECAAGFGGADCKHKVEHAPFLCVFGSISLKYLAKCKVQ